MKKKAGIMKIHNYSTNAPHEKVRTRSVVSKEAGESNGGTAVGGGGGGGGGVSTKQQRQTKPAQKAAHLSPELENTVNRLALEAGKQRGRKHGLPVEPEADDEVANDSQEGEAEEEEEEDGEPRGKQRKRGAGGGGTDEQSSSVLEQQRNRKQAATEADEDGVVIEEEEGVETESLVEDLNEDDRTSSSTVSAEETLDHVMESFNKGRITNSNLKSDRRGSSAAVASSTADPLIMTMDDYQQNQQQQQQQEDGADHVTMDDYDQTVTVVGGSASASDDIEETEGALAGGNRIFRKKVKRKLSSMRPNSGGGGGGAVGNVSTGAEGANCSSKAKLQMVHEFPMLFLGLRRNRMFLVNSLAQWFDLNQRDIILTLRKIKQNESSARLGSVFGLGATEVDLLFHTNVPKIADCLRNFIVWPDDITMKLNVPINLRQHFQRIHLILNYLVVRVKQNAVQQLPADEIAASFCPNDQCHKLKYLVASTLDGCVCFVSRAFGVQTDDEQVLNGSGFLTKFKTNTNLIAGKNFHNFEDRLANGHDDDHHTPANNNGGHGRRNRVTSRTATGGGDDDDLERVLGGSASNSNSEDNFEEMVSEKISKSRTFKLKNYIENILENFQSHQLLSPQTCIDGRTLKLLDDIVVIVGALINLQKQEIE
uniref:DDE Tnp4 domain-containing protein n=1 Tax=Anopheles dirus TaxID=7168 RepID=A0A182N498_9DIPT